MKTSVIFSSRENPECLAQTLFSYIDTCSDDNEVECLVCLDDNDETRHQVLETFENVPEVKLFVRPQVGYFKLQRSFNFMANEAKGDMFWFSSDKTVVKSERWDKILEPLAGKFFLAGIRAHWIEANRSWYRVDTICPIVSRLWFDIFGKICDHTHVDSCIGHTLGRMVDYPNGQAILDCVYQEIEEIEIEHDRRKDPAIYKPGYSEFTNPYWEAVRKVDAGILYDYLTRNPDLIPPKRFP